jgi:uncharacterized membrane protein YphA (DoxX/SURF4 family)
MFLHLRNVPARVAAGGFVLHTGLEKWNGSEEQAKGLGKVPPPVFLKALSAAEIGVGAALLLPIVSNKVAGAALTAFAGSLVGMYLRTPALRKPGSVWPNQSGIAVSKDVWMLGIGLGLLADDATDRSGKLSSS